MSVEEIYPHLPRSEKTRLMRSGLGRLIGRSRLFGMRLGAILVAACAWLVIITPSLASLAALLTDPKPRVLEWDHMIAALNILCFVTPVLIYAGSACVEALRGAGKRERALMTKTEKGANHMARAWSRVRSKILSVADSDAGALARLQALAISDASRSREQGLPKKRL